MAAALITFYFAGMTLGRFLSGLLSLRFSDWKIITIGESIILAAVCILLLTNTVSFAVLGLFLVGLGNGPIFPNMTHLTPILYKKETSQSIIGIEMAFSNLSIMLTPVLLVFCQTLPVLKSSPVFMAVMFAFMADARLYLKQAIPGAVNNLNSISLILILKDCCSHATIPYKINSNFKSRFCDCFLLTFFQKHLTSSTL